MTLIEFHPLANLFPLMEGAEFEELVADIKAYGQHEAIVILDRMILDGRNRYRACLAAGVTPKLMTYKGDDPVAFVISQNLRRRHLTTEQKRKLIAKLLKAAPEKSDRQIAETVKASPTTVGTVRAKMEAAGDVSKLDTRTDSMGRKQPGKKREPEKQITKLPSGDWHQQLKEWRRRADSLSSSEQIIGWRALAEKAEGIITKQRDTFDDLYRKWIKCAVDGPVPQQVDVLAGADCVEAIAGRAEARAAVVALPPTEPHPLDIPPDLRRTVR